METSRARMTAPPRLQNWDTRPQPTHSPELNVRKAPEALRPIPAPRAPRPGIPPAAAQRQDIPKKTDSEFFDSNEYPVWEGKEPTDLLVLEKEDTIKSICMQTGQRPNYVLIKSRKFEGLQWCHLQHVRPLVRTKKFIKENKDLWKSRCPVQCSTCGKIYSRSSDVRSCRHMPPTM